MRNAHPSRRQVEMAAEELDFDYFASHVGEAADLDLSSAGDELAGSGDLLAAFDAELDALPGTAWTVGGDLVTLRYVSVDLLAGRPGTGSTRQRAEALAWLDEVA